MTISRMNGAPREVQGRRGLDSLFDGKPRPPKPARDVEADLAALLDREMAAAEGGAVTESDGNPDTSLASPASQSRPAKPTSPGTKTSIDEAVDMPSRTAGRTTTVSAPVDGREAESETPLSGGLSAPGSNRRFGAIIMDPGASRVVTPSGPGAPSVDSPLPAVEQRTEAEKAEILSRLDTVLDPEWQRSMHRRIDELYKQVATEFSTPPENAEKALSLLREARQTLVESPENYVLAEYRATQVEALLERTQGSRSQSLLYGPRILAYEMLWIVVLLSGLVFATPLALWLGELGRIPAATMNDVFPFWSTMMWGGIGGVIGALYHLWWHVSEKQDFDRNYMMWYMVQPMMGLVLGGIVYLIIAGGFLVIQVNLTQDNVSTAARLLPYLTAVFAGFRQNFVYEQFDRLMALFTPGRSDQNG